MPIQYFDVKSENGPKIRRESLDSYLAKLGADSRMLALIYGDADAANPPARLAAQAGAVRGIAKLLCARFEPTISEGYGSACAELKRYTAEICTHALLSNDAFFFTQLTAAMRKVNSGGSANSTWHTIRLILLSEAQAGPVNLSRTASGLKKFWGITIDARSLGRIADRYGIPTVPRGRPKKSDT